MSSIIKRSSWGSLAPTSTKSIRCRRARFDHNDELPQFIDVTVTPASTSPTAKSTSAAGAAAAATPSSGLLVSGQLVAVRSDLQSSLLLHTDDRIIASV